MRRFRLRTLLAAIAFIALVCALFIDQWRAVVREQRHRAEVEKLRAEQDYLRVVHEAELQLTRDVRLRDPN